MANILFNCLVQLWSQTQITALEGKVSCKLCVTQVCGQRGVLCSERIDGGAALQAPSTKTAAQRRQWSHREVLSLRDSPTAATGAREDHEVVDLPSEYASLIARLSTAYSTLDRPHPMCSIPIPTDPGAPSGRELRYPGSIPLIWSHWRLCERLCFDRAFSVSWTGFRPSLNGLSAFIHLTAACQSFEDEQQYFSARGYLSFSVPYKKFAWTQIVRTNGQWKVLRVSDIS